MTFSHQFTFLSQSWSIAEAQGGFLALRRHPCLPKLDHLMTASINIFVARHLGRRLFHALCLSVAVTAGRRARFLTAFLQRIPTARQDHRHADFRRPISQTVPVLLQLADHRVQTRDEAASVLASEAERWCDDEDILVRSFCSQNDLFVSESAKRAERRWK